MNVNVVADGSNYSMSLILRHLHCFLKHPKMLREERAKNAVMIRVSLLVLYWIMAIVVHPA